MRLTQKITPKQITRVKYMSLIALSGLVVDFLSKQVADARIDPNIYDGPYRFGGESYAQFLRIKKPGGYIDEYTNKETFCHSWIIFPGVSLLPDAALGIAYLLFLFWLFIGISILADIFMEAIEVITSKSELVMVPGLDGKII